MKNKINSVVIKETKKIAAGVICLDILTLLIYLLFVRLDVRVILSLVIGSVLAVGNFLVMGIFLQRAIKKDQSAVKTYVRLSYTYRMLIIFIVLAVCLYSGQFDTIGLLLPLVFPRLIIAINSFLQKKQRKGKY